jgi:hypothetical protein
MNASHWMRNANATQSAKTGNPNIKAPLWLPAQAMRKPIKTIMGNAIRALRSAVFMGYSFHGLD